MRITPKILSVLSLSILGTSLSPMAAQSAGFYIQEQSVSGLGSAFAGSVTNLNDPSTIYFNPAGMTKLSGTQAQLAAHLLIPDADISNRGSTLGGAAISGGDGGNPYDLSPVPNGYVSHQLNDQIWLGLGVSAPFGLANEYDSDWFGRFDSIESELTSIDIQPSIAFKVNDMISIGGGINIQYSDAELTNAATFGVTEGLSTLEGDDWSVGYTLGAQIKPLPQTTIGLSYRSAISHELKGSVSNEGTTVGDFDVTGRADLDLPDIATFGVAQGLGDKWTVMGQATWFGWNNFEDITTTIDEPIASIAVNAPAGTQLSSVAQNYQTTWAFALGAEYEHSDKWTFRGGMQYDETPTTDEFRTTRTPDGDRTWLSGGGTYSVNEKIDVDFAATYIWLTEETVDLTRNNVAVPASVDADVDGSVGIISAGFTYKF